MSFRALLLLILALLLLPPLNQGGFLRKREQYKVKEDSSAIKECEKRPKMYLCSYHCEAHEQCQSNNICCSTVCGNVCVNLLDNQVWEEPMAPPDNPIMFGNDIITFTSAYTITRK